MVKFHLGCALQIFFIGSIPVPEIQIYLLQVLIRRFWRFNGAISTNVSFKQLNARAISLMLQVPNIVINNSIGISLTYGGN